MKYNTSKEQYRKIKQMNHRQMEDFLNNLVADSYNQGVDYALKDVSSCIEKGLSNAKGVGDKRYRDIIESISKAFNDCSKYEVKLVD